MHETAMKNGEYFFKTYAKYIDNSILAKVVEIGSQDVNGSLRSVCPTNFKYIGMDFQQGRGVDVVLDDPYKLPLDDASVDIVVSSSCFEHSEMFWLVFLEVMRVLKPNGLFYLNAPSAGSFHQYPVDCWRFYPDSGKALVTWARRNGINSALLESYTQVGGGCYQDFVAIFIKDEAFVIKYPDRILDKKNDFENGQIFGDDSILKVSYFSQNEIRLAGFQASEGK